MTHCKGGKAREKGKNKLKMLLSFVQDVFGASSFYDRHDNFFRAGRKYENQTDMTTSFVDVRAGRIYVKTE